MKWGRVITKDSRKVFVTPIDSDFYVLSRDPNSKKFTITKEKVEPVKWLPPIDPPAIICIGLNYKTHAEETNKPIPQYPILFMKNPSAITAHLEPIILPKVCEDEVDYEGELVIIIGKDTKDVSPEESLNNILGFTIGNDVSARIWQSEKGGGQWVRAKSFDTFAPIGPFVLPVEEYLDSNYPFSIVTRLNNKEVQRGSTAELIFNFAELISFISQDTTIKKGTVIFTGTPSGVGWARSPKITLKKGDTIAVEIERIGTLINTVS
ncbi:MAG: fumarylacetoacetate hydrolase family protein [Candidatus Hydrogenedentes bacterium]|nr:fumarylacetoacetate hydrolase family protein [Candidatus Hydrogenedentota bacterium]